MTKRQLLDKLQEYDDDAEVILWDGDCNEYTVDYVNDLKNEDANNWGAKYTEGIVIIGKAV